MQKVVEEGDPNVISNLDIFDSSMETVEPCERIVNLGHVEVLDCIINMNFQHCCCAQHKK